MNQKFKFALWLLVLPLFAFAQTITGVVTDTGTSQPLLGVSVIVKGTSNGAATDFDGKYTLTNVPRGATLVYSYLGYQSQEVAYTGQTTLNIALAEDPSELTAIVLIGYGSTTKENVTASQITVKEEEFNKGAVVSPGQLIAGKAAGVSVIAASGRPGDAPQIRVRAGSTLSGNQDALFVVDGIPLDQQNANLNTINPAEIESITILKDASATAIYGNRASNGVVLITTKKGKFNSDFKIGYDLQVAISRPENLVNVLTGDEFRAFINENGTPDDIALLGTANTDWQREIYETGVRAMHNITFEKGFENTGIRGTLAYTNENGTLLTSGYERVSLNGSVIQKVGSDLKLTLNVQGALEEIRNADGGAIGAAIDFDPTQSVLNTTGDFNGFFEYTRMGAIEGLAPRNPLGLLRSLRNETDNNQIRTTLQADYKIPGIEGLAFSGVAGIDYNEFDNFSRRDPNSGVAATTLALSSSANGSRINQLLNGRLDYKKDIESLDTKIELTAGSSYQNFRRESVDLSQDNATGVFRAPFINFNQNKLISAFGRATFDIKDLVVLSGSISRDGTSRFSPNNRWGTFGGASAAIKLTNTSFIENSNIVSQLKLRGGYGVTGQQDIIGEDFLFLQRVTPGMDEASIQIGDRFFTTIRPELSVDLKWETTKQYNVGIDFGFFDDVITGSVDAYTRNTEDLLNNGPLPVGSLGNFALQNVGSTKSEGIETQINVQLIKKQDIQWNIGTNVTFSRIRITDLALGDNDEPVPQTPVGGAGINNFIQEWAIGSDPTAFWVLRQVFDNNGRPLDGVFVDVNGDNVINDADRVRFKKATPDAFFGFTSNLNYKKLDVSFTLRGAVGGYNHNNVSAARDNQDQITENPGDFLNNSTRDVLATGFVASANKLISSYYIQKADFIKLDNLSLGYSFQTDKTKIRASVTGTNLLTITGYDGLDPEVINGIDANLFPRSTSVVLGLGLQF